MYLIMRHRSVFDPLPHNVHFAGAQPDRLIMQLDVKGPLEHKEQSSVSSWLMPDERTAEFDDHDVVPIELGDGPRCKVVGKLCELLRESHLLRHAASSWDGRLRATLVASSL